MVEQETGTTVLQANDSDQCAGGSNWTGEHDMEHLPFDVRIETYLVPVIFLLIFTAGVLGNGTLVLIFIRHRNMRSSPNLYILSLALGDLLVILTCVPFISTIYTVESWPYGMVICKLAETAREVSVSVSVFTLTALSVERYCAIAGPVAGASRRVGPLLLAAIWLLAAAAAVPTALYTQVTEEAINECEAGALRRIQVCYPFPKELAAPVVTARCDTSCCAGGRFAVHYALPLVLISVFYSLMAVRLRRGLPGEAPQRHIRSQRQRVARTLLTFVGVFFICFLPQHVFSLWFYWASSSVLEYNDWWHALRILGFCLSFANSCANPVALYCVSCTFRKHFDRYLLCWCRRGARPDTVVAGSRTDSRKQSTSQTLATFQPRSR
ncbi:neuropeptide CCHamide-1 receptor-like [Schistocerca serialis cubense]|uniref:neuropeptide CCHamide-1 receptor-like n=1 Tax=Schistocerca serialis cubense TaxID=2023355 RepID=UPI00214F27B1|nr:neuropeptide CCHamide-1 receptor-like [Schistocerca serialis cubense]